MFACRSLRVAAHLGTLPEQGVRFIEEQDPVELLGRSEDLLESLFGLPDVLIHHTRQIDVEQGNPKLPARASAAMVFPVPDGPAKRAVIPRPLVPPGRTAPVVDDSIPETNLCSGGGQLPFHLIGNDDVGEPEAGNHRAGQGSHI